MKIFELYVPNQQQVIDSILYELRTASEQQDFGKIEAIEYALRTPILFPTGLKFKKSQTEQEMFDKLFTKIGDTGHSRTKYRMTCPAPVSERGMNEGIQCLTKAFYIAASFDEYFPSRVLKKIQQEI